MKIGFLITDCDHPQYQPLGVLNIAQLLVVSVSTWIPQLQKSCVSWEMEMSDHRGVKGYTMLQHATACYSMLHVSFICTRVVSQSSSLEGSRSSLDTSFFCCSSRMKQFMGITPLPSFSIRKLSSNLQTISLSSDVLCAYESTRRHHASRCLIHVPVHGLRSCPFFCGFFCG